jgi:hypothetical protein
VSKCSQSKATRQIELSIIKVSNFICLKSWTARNVDYQGIKNLVQAASEQFSSNNKGELTKNGYLILPTHRMTSKILGVQWMMLLWWRESEWYPTG